MGNSKLSGAGGRSKLILGTAAASTGTRKRHDSEDQSISIYKNEKHCLRHATRIERLLARRNSFRAWYKPSPLESATRVGYGIVF